VLTATHLCEDEPYRWLNDVVCVGAGEVRTRPDGNGVDLVIDVAELVWEPPGDAALGRWTSRTTSPTWR